MMNNLNLSLDNNSNGSQANNETDNEVYNRLSSVPIFLSVYTVILLFAVVGNSLVCLTVKMNHKMHDVTNYMLVNLAVSDLVQALATIFQVTDFVVKNLNIGNIGCKFQINMVNIPYGSSVLTLTFIAFERYCAVCKPSYLHDVKSRMKWIIPSIWLLATAIYFPTLYYCGSRLNTETDQLSCDCTDRWPSLRAKNIYGIGIVVMLYAVPLTIVVALYSSVIRRLRRAMPGEVLSTNSTYQSRQGVVKMLLVTMVMFFLSWTPYNVLYFLKRIEVDFRSVYKLVWYPALLLAFLSCAYNPVIYCFMSKNFREGFKSACCSPLRVLRSNHSTGSSHSSTPSSRTTRRIIVEDTV